jgi:DNA-binding transcriptional LysR family regulator
VPLAANDLVPVIASHHALAGLADKPEALLVELPGLRRVVTHDTSTVDIARSAGLSSDGHKFYVQNTDQKLQAILAGIGIGHLPRQRIEKHLDSGVLKELCLSNTSNPECFLAWKISNRGKGLRALVQLLTTV